MLQNILFNLGKQKSHKLFFFFLKLVTQTFHQLVQRLINYGQRWALNYIARKKTGLVHMVVKIGCAVVA